MSTPGVGTHLGSYRIEELLGRGGMGEVYRAEDLRLGRKVALKLLAAPLTDDARFRSRFLAESRLAASIDHAGIIPIYEAGESDGHLYIAMRYVEGTDLAALLHREGPLPPQRALSIVGQLADALDAAHARGLLHRDVKPSNALIAREGSGEHVYLADFGLTKRVATEAGATASGQLVGTIDYLAPERIVGGPADHRADLYALGCVLHECLTGEPPFRRDSEVATMYAHLEDEPPRPSQVHPGTPPAVDAVVARALAKDPEGRWSSGAELVGAARAALGDDSGQVTAAATRALAAPRCASLARRPPRRLVLSVLAGTAALVALAVVVLTRGGHDPVVAIPDADAVAVIDPSKGSLVAQIPVGAAPAQVAADREAVWVTNSDAATVSRIDRRTRAIETVGVGNGPGSIAVGAGGVWVVNALDGTLSWISPATHQEVKRIPVGNGPNGVCVAAGAVWVASTFDHTIVRFDPATRITTTKVLDDAPTQLACGGGFVWATSQSAGTVTQISTGRRAGVVGHVNVGRGPSAVAWGRGSVWVANTADGTVYRLDGRSGVQTSVVPLPAGARPTSLAAGDDGIWVGDERAGTVARIDPADNVAGTPLKLGNRPQGLAVVDGALWVGVRAAGATHGGGTLRVVHPGGRDGFRLTVDQLDPAQSYDSIEVLPLTNDGLVTFRRAGGRHGAALIPDLAEALPLVTDGGRTYAFRLRRGSRYSTGVPVRASDIRRGIERVVLRRDGVDFYAGIRGATRCVTGRTRCDLSRGIVVDDAARTITFHLTAADPDFVNKLALFSGVAVAPGTPVGKLRHPLPATGPYQVDHVGRVIRLVRNPRFRPLDGRPAGYADAITIDCCEDPKRAVEVIRRGRGNLLVADFGVPASLRRALDGLATRYPGQLHTTPVAATIYAFLNTRMPPFDRLDARRAVNYAVDRAAFAALKGGERFAQPTCQFLPANFPGFRHYCPYTANTAAGREWTGPDLVRARRLVARSGTRGMPVAVVASVGLYPEEARLLAATLNRIGYRAHARILGKKVDYFRYIERRSNHVQIGLAGWSADYPSAAGYIRPIFGCIRGGPSAKERVNNPSGFCDAPVEQLSRRALSPGHADAADALWAQIDRRITDQAPAVSLINPRAVAFVSSRAGNYIYSQQYGTLYDQLWVD